MTFDAFLASLQAPAPPDVAAPLRALWFDARGEWDAAHRCVDELSDPASMWVHACLHRKEGDLWNAGYWYRRAGKPPHQGTFDEEWREIAVALTTKGEA